MDSGAGPPKFEDMEPPAYEVAVKLPTYEEAQQDKLASEERRCHGHGHPEHGSDRRSFDFIAAFPHSESQFDPNAADLALGTDVYFFSAFLGM
jgi:hypothetical protein